MEHNLAEKAVIERLVRWGEEKPAVRAMVLTSTRAIPDAVPDRFSDYDVILALTDMMPFHEDRAWLEAFGRVLALYHDPLGTYEGNPWSAYVTQYESGLKIDFTLWPVETLRRVAALPALPAEFDAGYRVLLDKDHLADGLLPPTYQAYIPSRPSEAQYVEMVEVLLLEAVYVAKLLWRDDLMAAKYILDGMMKQEHLLPMLEWHMESEHGWSIKTGPYGRGLKKRLRSDLWEGLEATYAGADPGENWTALFRSIDLMRKAAQDVGIRLGYAYPEEMELRAVAYLRDMQQIDREKAG